MKETWICEECSIKFKKFTEEVNHLLDKVVCDKCYNKCKECNGVGYFKEVVSYGSIPINDPYRKPHIERCDTCETFNNDEEVIQYLTKGGR